MLCTPPSKSDQLQATVSGFHCRWARLPAGKLDGAFRTLSNCPPVKTSFPYTAMALTIGAPLDAVIVPPSPDQDAPSHLAMQEMFVCPPACVKLPPTKSTLFQTANAFTEPLSPEP